MSSLPNPLGQPWLWPQTQSKKAIKTIAYTTEPVTYAVL